MTKRVVAVRFYKDNHVLQKVYKGTFAIFTYGGVVVNALSQFLVLLLCELCVLGSEQSRRCSNWDWSANSLFNYQPGCSTIVICSLHSLLE